MISWDPSLAVDVEEIDEQHRSIIALINSLEATRGQGDAQAVAQTLRFLRDYLDKHFDLETELMLDLGYPGIEAHRIQHELFANHLIFFEIEKEFGAVSDQMLDDILTFLTDWFSKHIAKEDKALGEFVRTQALSG